jgi:SAM-dependent methyltransferase
VFRGGCKQFLKFWAPSGLLDAYRRGRGRPSRRNFQKDDELTQMEDNRDGKEPHSVMIKRSRMFRYDELRYYGFGLKLGVFNALRNGFGLGPKKTLGKVLQPINSYARFPEYHFLGHYIEAYLKRFAQNEKPHILDVGSPKCFGLCLAFHHNVEIHLTDIYEPTIKEAEILWNGIKHCAKGKAVFSIQDARKLINLHDFDIVYSMSVIEHIEGEAADSNSIREMLRVLKPGGLLLVTVPIGQRYIEQDRIGFQGAARQTGDRNRYFFQRIYSPIAAEERIIQAASDATLQRAVTISRKTGVVSKLYRHLGTNIRGALGCLNPVLSAALNDSQEGILPPPSDYGELHSYRDLYGDLMMMWEKQSAALNAPIK